LILSCAKIRKKDKRFLGDVQTYFEVLKTNGIACGSCSPASASADEERHLARSGLYFKVTIS